MADDEPDWSEWITRVRAGDPAALHAFFARYGPTLERLAARNIEPGMLRRFGPESIAQSVCRTFVRRAQGDQFELADQGSLWRLLCAIALTKVRERARFHLRERRGVNREVHLDAVDMDAYALAPDRTPRPDEIAAFRDHFAHMLASLEDDERHMLELRLAGRTQVQIAATIGCSERTVRRLLKRLEDRLARDL